MGFFMILFITFLKNPKFPWGAFKGAERLSFLGDFMGNCGDPYWIAFYWQIMGSGGIINGLHFYKQIMVFEKYQHKGFWERSIKGESQGGKK